MCSVFAFAPSHCAAHSRALRRTATAPPPHGMVVHNSRTKRSNLRAFTCLNRLAPRCSISRCRCSTNDDPRARKLSIQLFEQNFLPTPDRRRRWHTTLFLVTKKRAASMRNYNDNYPVILPKLVREHSGAIQKPYELAPRAKACSTSPSLKPIKYKIASKPKLISHGAHFL